MTSSSSSLTDLSETEQEHVVNALHFLHSKFEGWVPLAKVLQVKPGTIIDVHNRKKNVSVNLAFRVARVLGVGFDALIAETWQEPGMCPRCGHKSRSVRNDDC